MKRTSVIIRGKMSHFVLKRAKDTEKSNSERGKKMNAQ